MSSRPKRKISQGQRQRLRYRLLIAGAISLAVTGAGFLLWLQLTKSEESHAAVTMTLSQDNLPTDMNIQTMIIAPADTSARGGRFKTAKPLSQTPILPTY